MVCFADHFVQFVCLCCHFVVFCRSLLQFDGLDVYSHSLQRLWPGASFSLDARKRVQYPLWSFGLVSALDVYYSNWKEPIILCIEGWFADRFRENNSQKVIFISNF